MALALEEPIPDWWDEVLLHLPPQPVSAPNANGGGQIIGMASNAMHIDDCLTPVWPAEVRLHLKLPQRFFKIKIRCPNSMADLI